jgi:hypothetical protein
MVWGKGMVVGTVGLLERGKGVGERSGRGCVSSFFFPHRSLNLSTHSPFPEILEPGAKRRRERRAEKGKEDKPDISHFPFSITRLPSPTSAVSLFLPTRGRKKDSASP